MLIIENLPENIIENLSTKSVDNFMDNLAINAMKELIKGFQQIDQFSISFLIFQYNQQFKRKYGSKNLFILLFIIN